MRCLESACAPVCFRFEADGRLEKHASLILVAGCGLRVYGATSFTYVAAGSGRLQLLDNTQTPL